MKQTPCAECGCPLCDYTENIQKLVQRIERGLYGLGHAIHDVTIDVAEMEDIINESTIPPEHRKYLRKELHKHKEALGKCLVRCGSLEVVLADD